MEEPVTPARAHLICRSPWFGVAGFALCGYFAYSSLVSLRDGDFYWATGWWVVLTWAVWAVLAAGLISEAQCGRERIFFGLLLLALAVGLVFSAWSSARPATVHHAREVSLTLWSLAALASLSTVRLSAPANK